MACDISVLVTQQWPWVWQGLDEKNYLAYIAENNSDMGSFPAPEDCTTSCGITNK